MNDIEDLVQWLRAQLDDEERIATDRGKLRGDVWTAVEVTAGRWEVVGVGGTVADHLSEWEARHIADHDPARVLREVEATRRIIDAFVQADEQGQHPRGEVFGYHATGLLIALKHFAAAYADRPGYDPERWKA